MTRWSHERSHMLRSRVLPGLDKNLSSPPSSLSLFLSILRSPHRGISSAGPVVRKTPETRVIPPRACVRACMHAIARCVSRPWMRFVIQIEAMVISSWFGLARPSCLARRRKPCLTWFLFLLLLTWNPPRFSRPSVSSNAPSRSRPDDFIRKSCPSQEKTRILSRKLSGNL